MYDYIKGCLVSQKIVPTGVFITVETAGVGYLLKTTERTLSELPEKNSEVKIYTSLVHREDTMLLCGFLHREERDLFEILQTVSGVGVKAALTIIDEFAVTELIGIMMNEDYRELARAKGIGQKSAQKIVLELKDKLLARQEYLIPETGNQINKETENSLEVKNVLLSLGYSKEEIDEAVKYALNTSDSKMETEDILKKTLQYLAQK